MAIARMSQRTSKRVGDILVAHAQTGGIQLDQHVVRVNGRDGIVLDAVQLGSLDESHSQMTAKTYCILRAGILNLSGNKHDRLRPREQAYLGRFAFLGQVVDVLGHFCAVADSFLRQVWD
jgi:hypothetical protein